MEPPQPLTARRPAASSLPNFQLPPPDLKYQPYNSASAHVSSSVLTPPVSSSETASSNGLPSYSGNQMGFWPPQAGNVPQYAFSSAPNTFAAQTQNQQQQHQQNQNQNQNQNLNQQHNSLYNNSNNNRPLYTTPSYPPRTVASPADDSLPQQQYSLSLPYPSASDPSQNGQQQQQHQQQQQQQQHQPSPHDAYGPRPPPTPTYAYPPTSTTTHPFPAYTQPSPPPRLSPNGLPPNTTTNGNPNPGNYRPFPYALPTLSGPIMSNVHSPGSQLSLVGGGGGSANAHALSNAMSAHLGAHLGGMAGYGPMYAPQGVGQGQVHAMAMDRPFKCDQCPQSFNRNHDLKRHKRIHLAVKPYPCGECEKSFSRKDALKRHVLVKGCGKPTTQNTSTTTSTTSSTNQSNTVGTSHSPPNKSDGTADDSPHLVPREVRRDV